MYLHLFAGLHLCLESNCFFPCIRVLTFYNTTISINRNCKIMKTHQKQVNIKYKNLQKYRSGDSTARIWTIPPGPCGASSTANLPPPTVLKHYSSNSNEKSKDVTTLDWNVCFSSSSSSPILLLIVLFYVLFFFSFSLCF